MGAFADRREARLLEEHLTTMYSEGWMEPFETVPTILLRLGMAIRRIDLRETLFERVNTGHAHLPAFLRE
jgi:hypothetical protein